MEQENYFRIHVGIVAFVAVVVVVELFVLQVFIYFFVPSFSIIALRLMRINVLF